VYTLYTRDWGMLSEIDIVLLSRIRFMKSVGRLYKRFSALFFTQC